MKATLTVGVSGSGKTTWARQEAQRTYTLITNRDDLRFSLTGATGWHEYSFINKTEKMVSELQVATVKMAADQKRDIIIADTNLSPRIRSNWFLLLKQLGFYVEVKEFDVGFEEAMRRDALRGNLSVGEEVLRRQWADWIKYKEDNENSGSRQ